MVPIINENIYPRYCYSTVIQGMTCPTQLNGKRCRRAHSRDEINPDKCRREQTNMGCMHMNSEQPFTCVYIHTGETKSGYTDRLGFDPQHIKYNNCTSRDLYDRIDNINRIIEELKDTIVGLNHTNVTAVNKSFWHRTNSNIRHLTIKRKFLRNILIKKIEDEDHEEIKKQII